MKVVAASGHWEHGDLYEAALKSRPAKKAFETSRRRVGFKIVKRPKSENPKPATAKAAAIRPGRAGNSIGHVVRRRCSPDASAAKAFAVVLRLSYNAVSFAVAGWHPPRLTYTHIYHSRIDIILFVSFRGRCEGCKKN